VHGDGLVRIDKIVKPLSAGNNDLLVRVDSAGLNSADLMMIAGKHHLKPDIPYVPGVCARTHFAHCACRLRTGR
jgi:NADPH:quinone reductase-like Zn-dependent oxidoreductase